jgi:aerobic-type carbon monoxide dehydrogenase small subunit (CoxS/CutS family)
MLAQLSDQTRPLTPMTETVSFRLNDQPVQIRVAPDRTLLWVLRTELAMTGPKYGCGINQCGACTVLVDQRAVRACNVPVRSVAGRDVVTIEGLARGAELHPLQQAFIAHDALQCGFCTPGMILTACAFLRAHPNPTREAVIAGMDQNLCRCGAHVRIVDAILTAAAALRGGAKP